MCDFSEEEKTLHEFSQNKPRVSTEKAYLYSNFHIREKRHTLNWGLFLDIHKVRFDMTSKFV